MSRKDLSREKPGEMKSKLNAAQKELEKARKEIEELQKKLNKTQKESEEFQKELEKARKEREELQKELEKAQKELEAAQEKLKKTGVTRNAADASAMSAEQVRDLLSPEDTTQFDELVRQSREIEQKLGKLVGKAQEAEKEIEKGKAILR